MTVLEAIQKSTEFLGRKGVVAPRLQTELLLAHLLGLPRMNLYLNFERALTPAETAVFREWIKRRGGREPLQHITGTISFCGLEMAVNRHALVPRPETELLAELGWHWLASVSAESAPTPDGSSPAALDLGTGTGCLAIALAVNCPNASVVATDISPEALALAKQNAQRHRVSARIEFLAGDGFQALTAAPPGEPPAGPPRVFDLILSNPPYIPTAEIATLPPEVREFDPHEALDGGVDGLDFYRRIAASAAGYLRPGGRIMLEFGDDQAPKIRPLFEGKKWIVEAIREDYSQRARMLIARR